MQRSIVPTDDSGRRAALLAAAAVTALLAITAAIHWPAPGAQFSYDDRDFVERNQSIRTPGAAVGVFFRSFPPDQPERGLYRPLTNLSYALDFSLYGPSARGFHATNVLLYCAVVAFVFALALAYFPSLLFAIAVAAAFALHPVHSDAVDSVAGRSELLCLLFSIACLSCFVRGIRSEARTRWHARSWFAASTACMALACLAKETGAVLPAILAVHALALTRWPTDLPASRRLALSVRRVAPQLLLLAGYCVLRVASLGRFAPAQTVLGGDDLATRAFTIGSVFAEYARLLVHPRALHLDYFYQHQPGVQHSFSFQSALGWALLSAFFAGFLLLLVRELRRRGDPSLGSVGLCALAIAFGFFLPVSHLVDFGALLAERFVFAPSLGFVLLAVLGATAFVRRVGPPQRALVLCAALTLAVLAGMRSHARQQEWRDELLLWSVEAAATPADPRVLANLGAAQLRRGDFAAAQRELTRALALDPQHVSALNNLAYAHLQRGQLEAAAGAYGRTLEVDPQDFVAWNGLGVVAAQAQDPARAQGYFERAAQINPNYATAARNLAAASAATSAARQFVETHRAEIETSADPELRTAFEQACRAAGDSVCAELLAVGQAEP